jgi:chromosome partitioning protein
MKVISVINEKGGVGKTTISGNLIYGLQKQGYRVLALDIDPQCNLTTALIPKLSMKAQKTPVKTIRNWFEDILNFEENPTTISQIARREEQTWSDDIQLVPGDDLEEVRRQITRKVDDMRPKEYINFYTRLRTALHSLQAEYDFVIIDCPPSADSPITQCALVATDY